MSRSRSQPFAVFDLETDPFSHGNFPRPFASGFFDGKTYVQSWGKNCLVDVARWISSFPGIVYAHNGGKFDVHYLLDFLDVSKPVRFVKINGRIAKLPFGSAEIRDSFLLLPVALAKLDKLEIDYDKLHRDRREEFQAEICRYLEHDCRSLHDKIGKFFDEFGKGLTLANRAFDQMKRIESVQPPRTTLNYDSKFREFYYGGRVQALQRGEHHGSMVYLDINSAYPFAMLSRHWFAPDYMTLDSLPASGVEQCLIEFEGFSRAALPKRDEKTGALSFPIESGTWKCTGWEFVAGVELGRITPDRILRVHRPSGCRDFRQYVEHFARMRDEAKRNGDKVRDIFAKLMHNSCYGKMAINPRHFTENVLCRWGLSPDDDENGEWGPPHSSNEERGFWEYERPQILKSSPCYNVATAASITGYVRAYLLRAMDAVSCPIYCDTDSLMCRDSGTLPLGDQMGQWKTEAELDYAAIAGKKLYAVRKAGCSGELPTGRKATREEIEKAGWKIACKGGRPQVNEIIDAVRGKVITWRNDAPAFTLGTRSKLFVERKIQRSSVEVVNF